MRLTSNRQDNGTTQTGTTLAQLGNAWHLPDDPEPRGRAGMRLPIGAIVPGTAVTITSGSQFQGDGKPGNQLQDGSLLVFRGQSEPGWRNEPLRFESAFGNNKYYGATIPPNTFQTGTTVQYYLKIAYNDHDTTFICADPTGLSRTTGDEADAQGTPFSYVVESAARWGLWSPVFGLPNVAIHASVLHTGQVLMWGRRGAPEQSLDVHETQPFLWDPTSGQLTAAGSPASLDGTPVNLFCSGHSFLPDGRLLIVGGHWVDGEGLNQATIYDPATNTWTATAAMNNGRWYPTAASLPDGNVLVLSGSYRAGPDTPNNPIPQIWQDGGWSEIAGLPKGAAFELYPRTHLASDGRVVMTGSLWKTWSLDPAGDGQWQPVAERAQGQRDYCPSVLYDVDRVIYIGGGNDPTTHQPTAAAEIIRLDKAPLRWQPTDAMHFPRRQHNGTVLPDGTVLVTGGTRGGGGPGPQPSGFNDLGAGQPVQVAELWDPASGQWTLLAAEEVDRCYHSTAVLLPDGRVLSAGGGEYKPAGDIPNDAQDSHRDAQVFSPPYLFKGPQPAVTAAPESLDYGGPFEIATPAAHEIGKVSLVGLSSVTHSFNMTQRLAFLPFQAQADKLTVTGPVSSSVCPPGYYMLFILSKQGVPSVAHFIRLALPPSHAGGLRAAGVAALRRQALQANAFHDAAAWRHAIRLAAHGTAVTVGITATCPYGLNACWGGANEALSALEGVQGVDPIVDAHDSVATLYLDDERLPALPQWREQFSRLVNGRYELRGVEVTLEGRIHADRGMLYLSAANRRPRVRLTALDPAGKIQWDRNTGAPPPLTSDEEHAFRDVTTTARQGPNGAHVRVTGPLERDVEEFVLHVRRWHVA